MAARTYQLVLAGVEGDLTAGRLTVGEKLPGERAMAERYQVSRASVREAVRILEALGVIRTAVGSGPDAGATITADLAAPMGAALRWHLASRHLPVADLVQARVLIETWSAGAAAAEADPGRLADAARLLDAMDLASAPTEFLALDARFHVALAECAGNSVVAAIMSAMRTGIESYVTAATDRIDDWPTMVGRLRAEHRAILDAVRDGRAADASSLVSRHITGFYLDAGVG